MRNIEALRNEIPSAPDIKQFLQDFFKTDKAARHLTVRNIEALRNDQGIEYQMGTEVGRPRHQKCK